MSENVQNEMTCSTFETLLDEALEGGLGSARMASFEAHAASCPNCGPVLEFAKMGFASLHALPDLEPPRHLVHNILAATSGAESAQRVAAKRSWRERTLGWVRPTFAPMLSPKFAMSTGMAFFSFMLVLNLAGVKLSDLRHLDLHPSAVQHAAQHTYYDTEARVVKYYENIRLVYQIQSSVRAIKDASRDTDTNGTQPEHKQKPAPPKEKNDTSSDPDRRQQRQQQQYSHDMRERTLALYRAPSPLIEEPFSPQNRRDS